MSVQTILILVIIGISAGILSGFVGVGGGVIIVPALVYVLGMSQFEELREPVYSFYYYLLVFWQ